MQTSGFSSKCKVFCSDRILDEIQECIASFSDRVTGIRQGQQLELFQNISVTAVAVPHDVYRADANGNEKHLAMFLYGRYYDSSLRRC